MKVTESGPRFQRFCALELYAPQAVRSAGAEGWALGVNLTEIHRHRVDGEELLSHVPDPQFEADPRRIVHEGGTPDHLGRTGRQRIGDGDDLDEETHVRRLCA